MSTDADTVRFVLNGLLPSQSGTNSSFSRDAAHAALDRLAAAEEALKDAEFRAAAATNEETRVTRRLAAAEARAEAAERERDDWARAAQTAAFGALRDRTDEAEQGVEYALACIAEWQQRCNAAEARAETFAEALREIRDVRLREDEDSERAVNDARMTMREIARAALAAVTRAEAAEKRLAPENPSNVTRY